LESVVVVAYPDPIRLEARPVEHAGTPDGSVALAYFFVGRIVARGVVPHEAVEAIQSLLRKPVSIALAAEVDDDGNIDGRVCLVLPVDPRRMTGSAGGAADEPWRDSVGDAPSFGQDADAWKGGDAADAGSDTRLALFPIGNAVRSARDRRHPDDVAADVRDMLENLLAGKGRDAVAKAIDDLLHGI
jgi:hypothetical protein